MGLLKSFRHFSEWLNDFIGTRLTVTLCSVYSRCWEDTTMFMMTIQDVQLWTSFWFSQLLIRRSQDKFFSVRRRQNHYLHLYLVVSDGLTGIESQLNELADWHPQHQIIISHIQPSLFHSKYSFFCSGLWSDWVSIWLRIEFGKIFTFSH